MDLDHVAAFRSSNSAIGVWNAGMGDWSAETERSYAREVERMGFGSLWFGENPGSKEALTHASLLLAATERLVVGTGIASVAARDCVAASNGGLAMAEAYDARFVLGLGVSHRVLTEARGGEYSAPLKTMSDYLDGMAASQYAAPPPRSPLPVVIAALRDKMLALGRDKADGVHTYLVTPNHTAHSRGILGPEPLLIVEQGFVLSTYASIARESAREHLSWYLSQPNYQASMLQLGFTSDQIGGGGGGLTGRRPHCLGRARCRCRSGAAASVERRRSSLASARVRTSDRATRQSGARGTRASAPLTNPAFHQRPVDESDAFERPRAQTSVTRMPACAL